MKFYQVCNKTTGTTSYINLDKVEQVTVKKMPAENGGDYRVAFRFPGDNAPRIITELPGEWYAQLQSELEGRD